MKIKKFEEFINENLSIDNRLNMWVEFSLKMKTPLGIQGKKEDIENIVDASIIDRFDNVFSLGTTICGIPDLKDKQVTNIMSKLPPSLSKQKQTDTTYLFLIDSTFNHFDKDELFNRIPTIVNI